MAKAENETGESGKSVCANQVIDVFRFRPDDGADASKGAATDEEPAATEDVGEAADNEEADRQAECESEGNPGDVDRRSDVKVDDGEGIRRHDPSQVPRDIAQTKSLEFLASK